jgi:hypothetical protein
MEQQGPSPIRTSQWARLFEAIDLSTVKIADRLVFDDDGENRQSFVSLDITVADLRNLCNAIASIRINGMPEWPHLQLSSQLALFAPRQKRTAF